MYIINMLTIEEKQASINQTKMSEADTGSSAVQISILTKKIDVLNQHIKSNHKDNSCKRGLLGAVQARRKYLKYLKKNNSGLYEKVISILSIRK